MLYIMYNSIDESLNRKQKWFKLIIYVESRANLGPNYPWNPIIITILELLLNKYVTFPLSMA